MVFYNIGILIPATTRGRDWTEFKYTDLYIYLLKSLFRTYDMEHKYTIYIGIDKDDKLYKTDKCKNDIIRFISVMKNASVKFIEYDFRYKGNPCAIWTDLYKKALDDNNDYFVQAGSDIMFVDKYWVNTGIEKLKEKNNIGVVGLYDAGRGDKLFTQTMVSRKHYDIFGFYYPPEIRNWYCDNWIGDIYENYSEDLKLYLHQRIYNCGGEPRYEIPTDCKRIYEECMYRYRNLIKVYLNAPRISH